MGGQSTNENLKMPDGVPHTRTTRTETPPDYRNKIVQEGVAAIFEEAAHLGGNGVTLADVVPSGGETVPSDGPEPFYRLIRAEHQRQVQYAPERSPANGNRHSSASRDRAR